MAVDLMSLFKEKTSKIKDDGINRVAEFDVLYSTGFLALDYLNGTIVHVDSKDRQFTYNSAGIVDGSANAFIGRPNSGKSTLTTQVAGNIVRPFIKLRMPTGLFIEDIEGSLPVSRRNFLLNLSSEEINKYVKIRNSGINTENVLQRIRLLRDTKINNRKDFEYDTGKFDVYGNRIFKLIPTVYMIDSLPMLLPKELSEEEELGGSMSATSIAKANTMFAKQITQWCKEANIILFTVNHITEEINMSFIPKAAQISGLKQSEHIPGGRAVLYLANNMFRTDDTNQLKDTEGFGINGSIVRVTLVKSRTNSTRRSIPLIFNKTDGKFDEILSMFQLLKEESKLKGAGSYQYIEACPDIKFSQKSFKDVFNKNEDLQREFAKELYNVISGYLSETKIKSEEGESKAYNNLLEIFESLSLNEG